MQAAIREAQAGSIVILGITPDSPETGYGYIQTTPSNASATAGLADPLQVQAFVEKPNLETAQKYLQQGGYFWNAGIFCFRAGTVLDQLEQHAKEVVETMRACLARSQVLRGDKLIQRTLDALSFEQALSKLSMPKT